MNELSLYEKFTDPLAAVERLGALFEKSGMFGCTAPGQGSVLAFTCLAEHKTPMEVAAEFDIVKGKLAMKAVAMLSRLEKAGGKYNWIATGEDGKCAALEIEFNGRKGVTEFTIEDAKRAGLVRPDSNWIKWPGAMLRARCTSKAMKIYAPSITAGYYVPEEVQDFEEPAEPREPRKPYTAEEIKDFTKGVKTEVGKEMAASSVKSAETREEHDKVSQAKTVAYDVDSIMAENEADKARLSASKPVPEAPVTQPPNPGDPDAPASTALSVPEVPAPVLANPENKVSGFIPGGMIFTDARGLIWPVTWAGDCPSLDTGEMVKDVPKNRLWGWFLADETAKAAFRWPADGNETGKTASKQHFLAFMKWGFGCEKLAAADMNKVAKFYHAICKGDVATLGRAMATWQQKTGYKLDVES